MVWNLLLQDGSEGPSLIDYSVTQKTRLSPPLLLMAHSKDEPEIGIGFQWPMSLKGRGVRCAAVKDAPLFFWCSFDNLVRHCRRLRCEAGLPVVFHKGPHFGQNQPFPILRADGNSPAITPDSRPDFQAHPPLETASRFKADFALDNYRD